MACTPLDELRVRAEAIAREVAGAKVVDTEAVAGGGSLPGLGIASCGVAIEGANADQLRAARVVARVEHGRVICDLRSVDPRDDARIIAALQ
jgi:L-seryl-tRNA(Ser) seleniumtransferase